jgi:hypothetical protein
MEIVKKDMKSNYKPVSGIFLKHEFDHLIFDEEEIGDFTGLKKCDMTQKQVIPFDKDFFILHYYIENLFDQVKMSLPDCEDTED